MKGKQLITLLLFGIALVTINASTMAQKQQKYREEKIVKTSAIIQVSADDLWQIVRQFDKVEDWFTSIDHSVGTGEPEFEGATCSERTCHVNIKGYSEVREKLTLFDEEKRELAYEFIGGGPGFLLFAGNRWQVKEVGPNQSTITMNATMRLKPFMGFLLAGKMKKTVAKNLTEALDELKIFAETGEPSAAKKERQRILEKKKSRKAA